jgi:hypothetical protein
VTAEQVELASTAPLVFSWKDFSRFIDVARVEKGWLVLWGIYREMGAVRELSGQRTYTDLAGVRRRVADAAFELTHDERHASEALLLFDRTLQSR